MSAKGELKTKNSTKPQLRCRSVEFLVFNSDYLKISVPSDGENRVEPKRKKTVLVTKLKIYFQTTNMVSNDLR